MIPGPSVQLSSHSRGGIVVLRHPAWADFEDWSRLRELSSEALRQWEPDWMGNHQDRKAYKRRLSAYRRLASGGAAYPFHIFDPQGQLVGACNLSDIRRGSASVAQIGYWIGSPYLRRGYGLAAVEAVLRFAFTQLGLHRIEAVVQAGNEPSVKLLEQAGFQCEGTARGLLKVEGEWRDHLQFARLSSD